MSSSDKIITLELRQQKANNVNGNGDFKTILQNPITIEEGDEIVVTNTFLDTTVSTTTTIDLEDDILIRVEFFPWVNNIFSDSKTVAPALDGCKHVPCNKVSHGGGLVGFELIDNIAICSSFAFFGIAWGNVTVLLNYIDVNNTLKKISVYVTPGTAPVGSTQEFGLGIIAKTGSLTLDPTNTSDFLASEPYYTQVTFNTLTQPLIDEAIENFQPISGIIVQSITQPQSFHQVFLIKEIRIPAGTYAPDQFAVEFTKQMTRNLQSATEKRNAFGVTNELLQASYVFSELTFVNAESSFVEPKDDVISTGFTYVNSIDNSVWLGTNQFDLTYDPESTAYVIQDMHMPIYVDGNKVSIQFSTGTGGVFPALAYSGICITDITATNLRTNIAIPNFAFNVMGFEMGKLSPTITYVVGSVLDEPDSLFPNLKFIPGVNHTQAFNGIDLRVSKDINDTAQSDLSAFSKVSVTDKIVSIVGDSTDAITGGNIFASGTYTFGYYKVEINSGFKNLLVSEETIQRNIMAIVSKYYESQSYTDGVDGIPYIHKGLPLQLSSLGVRILNSDNVLPNTLGSDNTVFVRITKAQQVPAVPRNIPEKKPA